MHGIWTLARAQVDHAGVADASKKGTVNTDGRLLDGTYLEKHYVCDG